MGVSTCAHGHLTPGSIHEILSNWMLYSYESAEAGDLNLRVGDTILWVYTKHEGVPDGWWLGKNERTGSWGTFPCEFATRNAQSSKCKTTEFSINS